MANKRTAVLKKKSRHIVILIENLPVPLDRRVWQEARALVNEGYQVSVICPMMKGFNRWHEKLEGVNIYRYPLIVEADGAFGYLIEYSSALFFHSIFLFFLAVSKGFSAIQACNPPDLLFLVALPYKLFGVKFIFDHHDLNPELFESKFGKKGFFYSLLLKAEKLTFNCANAVISTNESFKEIAINRGNVPEDAMTVVRSGPDLNRLEPLDPEPSLKKGKSILIGYIGVIGKQDGLDLLIQILDELKEYTTDFHCAIIGDGTELPIVKKIAKDRNLDSHIDFYGMIYNSARINQILSTCDICVNPDVPDELNDKLTTNKVMEYMVFGKPIVQFDLKEGRRSAQEASLYVPDGSTETFAKLLWELINDPEKRQQMGEYGRERMVSSLSWSHEKKKYIQVYNQLFTS